MTEHYVVIDTDTIVDSVRALLAGEREYARWTMHLMGLPLWRINFLIGIATEMHAEQIAKIASQLEEQYGERNTGVLALMERDRLISGGQAELH